MGTCEGCGNLLTVRYGSGRFCGARCARSSSTRAAREAINAKVSATLKGRPSPLKVERILKPCPTCGGDFLPKGVGQTFCCNRCATSHPDRRERQSLNAIAQLQAGRNAARTAVRCSFRFGEAEVRCDSRLEYACLDWFVRHHIVSSMARCPAVLFYLHEGRRRRYLPDFIVKTEAGTFIIECKGDIYSRFTHEKWSRYRESIPEKRAALEAYAADNDLLPFWFEKGTPGSRYRSRKLFGT